MELDMLKISTTGCRWSVLFVGHYASAYVSALGDDLKLERRRYELWIGVGLTV